MEYSAPLSIEQVVSEKRTFHLDKVFKEGWRVFKQSPFWFFLVCFPSLIIQDLLDSLPIINVLASRAIFWAFLPVCVAFLSWNTLSGCVSKFSRSFPGWSAFKNPLLCGLLFSCMTFTLVKLYEVVDNQLSGSQGMAWQIFDQLSFGLFIVLLGGLLLAGPVGILYMVDREVDLKLGVLVGFRAIIYQIGRMFLFHVGWMINAGVLALVMGGIGSLIAAFAFPESFFIVSLQSPLELGILARNVSEETGEITLNLFVLTFEYVGMAIGYGIGLCTLAVVYAQVFGLPGYVEKVGVEN